MKQVMIIRKDLKMRQGKAIAQGCHASLQAALWALDHQPFAYDSWEAEGMTKIVVYVKSEEELKNLYQTALNHKLPAALILDAGKTEFKGPTFTSVAIGPAENTKVDIITGSLPLL